MRYVTTSWLNFTSDQAVNVTVSLHSAHPGQNGASELAGGTPAYARKQAALTPAQDGKRYLSEGLLFDIPAGSTVAWVGYWTEAGGGMFIGADEAAGETYIQQGFYLLRHEDSEGNPVAVLSTLNVVE